ncbi:hypothetical protein AB0F88_28990 [Streptosporangium sp. NPDC023963]|uniref:hypothetical protein n=1 Tax=Streptosporangium sp. NPDC023963 TaxID=3155608 RepID=UPI003437AA37
MVGISALPLVAEEDEDLGQDGGREALRETAEGEQHVGPNRDVGVGPPGDERPGDLAGVLGVFAESPDGPCPNGRVLITEQGEQAGARPHPRPGPVGGHEAGIGHRGRPRQTREDLQNLRTTRDARRPGASTRNGRIAGAAVQTKPPW